MKAIEVKGKVYPVIIERKAIKNMYMRIKPEQCLLITCSFRVSDEQIDSFIHAKMKWIESVINKSRYKLRSLENGSRVNILNHEFELLVQQGIKENCLIKQDQVLITVKELNEQRINSVFYKTMTSMLNKIIEDKKGRWDQMLDDYRLSYPRIQIKKMKSRWGSCTPSKGLIVMNVMLMHYPMECIDAVLLHEYVHLIVPNHSKRFYEIIENHMPDYKRIHALLK